MVIWRPPRPSSTNSRLECKNRKKGDAWSSKVVNFIVTKWSRAKANRLLPREHTGHSKQPPPTTGEYSTYTWPSQDGQYLNHIDYILCN